MLRFFISLLLFLGGFCVYAEELLTVRVWLLDKEGCEYSVTHPDEFMSERSIARHKRDNVNFSLNDLPISKVYKNEIATIANRFICHSNWLNSLVIECDSAMIENIKNFPFVRRIEVLCRGEIVRNEIKSEFYDFGDVKRHPLYGVAQPISKAANATQHHKKGCWGKDVFIAVLDDGFGGVDTLTQWFDKERIKFNCDIVNPNGDIFREDDHGTAVLSIMLANRIGEFVGVAPESDYALIRTEDIGFEAPFEEDFFVRGLEIADSLGVDIVNASLGYEQVGDITSVSCIASEIATKKGIKVVTSCGNKGDGGFTLPANADGVIAVGGTDKRGRVIDFTSKEFIDGRHVAPKVKALASDVPVINGGGKIMSAYGTSFAAPAISGAIAVKENF
ncbi:MAG: S8 family serine peptidase [Muribaculaceae bacterium]|nr:S8 family serine peptidase [Muribaculaceae bacterium]